MGASDSKLVFKQGIFRLSGEQEIPADDPYWTGFWELPESPEDVFSLFSPTDIRRARDQSLPNFEKLILAICSRLIVLRNHPSFPDPEIAPERDALNCIRVLTRLFPYIYEVDNLEEWEERFFWGARRKRTRRGQIRKTEVLFDESNEDQIKDSPEPEFEEAKPLAEELIDTLVDLLFFAEFTLPKGSSKNKVTYAIWQSGVGCNNPIGTSTQLENNRMEILRLLLVMTSKSMYMSPSEILLSNVSNERALTLSDVLPVKGVKAITYITTCNDKQVVLSLLCSLLNTTLKYNPAAWRVPYANQIVTKDSRQLLVTYCLQLLLVFVLYPIPETGNGVAPKNFFRHFLGRLHRPQDFQFLVDGMTRILNQPLQATNSYLPGSQKSLTWAPEMIMIFWETLQCNKRFRSFIVDTDRAHDFTILVLFYALESRTNPSRQGIVRMCVFVLQTLSSEQNYGKSLNKPFEGQDSLPASIRIQNFLGSYADYIIASVHTLILASKYKLDAIYPALLAVVNNIAPYMENISRATSSKIINLFSYMSSPSFLLANETNHSLLHSLLESMNAIIEHQFQKNPLFVLTILRSKKRYEALRDFTLEGGREEIERQMQQRKERQADSFSNSPVSRGNSHDTIRSPSSARTPSLSNVPEDNTFTIGEDEDESDEEERPSRPLQQQNTPSASTSRATSVSSSIDETLPLQLRGMSEKARGKMPAGHPSFSRQSSSASLSSANTPTVITNGHFTPSVEWIESWLLELPLHTILTLISDLEPQLPPPSSTTTGTPNPTTAPSTDSTQALALLRAAPLPPSIEPAPARVHLFEWSPLSLGWYESLLWGFVYLGELAVSRGSAAGVWAGTAIRLFRVQEVAAVREGPSLLKPMGAVDAVGSNLVQRLGGLGVRGGSGAGTAGSGGGGGSGAGAQQRGMTVRDV
ncbi:MAG: hypothetical protein M1822_002812 [Bathelium mastoideum]|nr:MAG: hypothetical protein M1822_002812 [Bathelium mastoideum]